MFLNSIEIGYNKKVTPHYMFDGTIKYERSYAGPLKTIRAVYIGDTQEILKKFLSIPDTDEYSVVFKYTAQQKNQSTITVIPTSISATISPEFPGHSSLTITGYFGPKISKFNTSQTSQSSQEISINYPTSVPAIDGIGANSNDFVAVEGKVRGSIESITFSRNRAHTLTAVDGYYDLLLHAWEPITCTVTVVVSNWSGPGDTIFSNISIDNRSVNKELISYSASNVEGTESMWRITETYIMYF